MCSGSAVVTAYDFESFCPGLNPEWGLKYYYIRFRLLPRSNPRVGTNSWFWATFSFFVETADVRALS